MYGKKILLLMFAMLALCFTTFAQAKTKDQIRKDRAARIEKLRNQEDENALIYNKQSAFAIRLNTDGYGIFYERGKYKKLSLTNLWWISLDERKDPKEQRVTNNDGTFQIGNAFVYGKINNFYQLKAGLGQQRLIGGKDIKNGIAVSAIYGGGISAGLVKPYYINTTDSAGNSSDIRYSSSTDKTFRDGPINGSGSFGKGFNQISVVPGVFARAALRFDYGRFNELLSAIETGITAQYYTKNIQMMIDQPGKKFFFNAYVALVFGKRK